MKKLFLSAISIALAGSAYAQLNTFQEGDVISAEQMNQNFEAILKKSMVVRSTTVDCDAGKTINAALTEGYNDITIFGTCNEEIVAMSLFDGTAIGRQERFPSEPVGHIIITGGEENRGAVLASQVSSAFQASLQLRNLTVTNRISVFANSFLFMKDVTHDIAPENEGTLRVAENSVVYIQESDLNEQITLNNSSTVLIQNVDLDVSSEGPFISVEKNSVLELNDVNIIHQSEALNVVTKKDIENGSSIFFAKENSTISAKNTTLQTTTSAAFFLDQGSSLRMVDSAVTSSSRFSIGIIRSHLYSDSTSLVNLLGQPLIIADGSHGRLHNSSVTSKAGYNAISLEGGSYLSIFDQSIIETNISNRSEVNDHSTIGITKFANLEIENSTVTNQVTNSNNNNHEAIWMSENSNLKLTSSTIISSNSTHIDTRNGSSIYLQEGNNFSQIDEGVNIKLSGRSSLYFVSEENYSSLTVECSGQSYVQQEISNLAAASGCLTD